MHFIPFVPDVPISSIKNLSEFSVIFMYRDVFDSVESFTRKSFLELQHKEPNLVPFCLVVKDYKKDFEEIQKEKSPVITNIK
jgi:hypothetical protein